MYVQGTL